MRLNHRASLIQARAGVPSWNAKIVAACFSSGENQRLAFATADRVVLMYDEKGERVDKFVTKATNSDSKIYIVQ